MRRLPVSMLQENVTIASELRAEKCVQDFLSV